MKDKKLFSVGLILIAVFVFWTILILTFDVQPVGVMELLSVLRR